MAFQISTVRKFCASHQLKLYDGSMEPLHGHNWVVKVTVQAEQLDAIGVVMDFHDLEKRVDEIVMPWHNTHLNDSPAFQTMNPSTENVAFHVGKTLLLPQGVRLVSVEVWETAENSAVYLP